VDAVVTLHSNTICSSSSYILHGPCVCVPRPCGSTDRVCVFVAHGVIVQAHPLAVGAK